MDTTNTSSTIRAVAQARGIAYVSRALAVPRATIGTYLGGCARPASIERIERRAHELGWDAPAHEELGQ